MADVITATATTGVGNGFVPLVDPELAARKRLRSAWIAMAMLGVGLFGAAAALPIQGAVIATGEVSVESKVKKIAHPAGGVISQVLVHDGDHVRKGQALLRFDAKVSGTAAQLSALGVDQLLAQRARLIAEREDRRDVTFPPELAVRTDEAAQAAMASERRLFQLRQLEQSGQEAQLRERLRQQEQEISAYQRQIAALRQQSAIIEPERQGLRKLWDKRLVSITRLNQLERTAVDLNGSAAALEAHIAESRAHISEIREQMINLRQTARSDAGSELARIEAALTEQQVRSVSAGDTFDKSIIRAPYAGVVDKLAYTTVGGFVPPAETILEIVPDADELVVETMISPVDIDQVRKGQQARVRFSAFNSRTTPEFQGVIDWVSADRATNDRTGATFYRARIKVDRSAVSREQQMRLVPGMPAEVFIQTSERSMLSYITKPIRDQFERAFRDES